MSPWTAAAVLVAAGSTLLLWLPAVADLLALRLAASRSRHTNGSSSGQPSGADAPRRLLFIVCAHNESLLIDRCVGSLLRMGRKGIDFRVRVLLDACTDDTRDKAIRAGAETHDFGPRQPIGKARLLELAAEMHDVKAFDALVVIDADSMVAPDFAEALSRTPRLREIVQQGHHAVSNPDESWLTRLAALLNRARYEGQLILHARAGLNAPLSGNGMCFGADVIARHGLRCATIKEDLELYARYTLSGVEIRYRPEAKVYAQEARSLSQARASRTRWESGRWTIIRRYAGKALTAPIATAQKVDLLTEITTHGPVVSALAAIATAGLLWFAVPDYRILTLLPLGSISPFLFWGGRALLTDPKPLRTVASLAFLIPYAVWRFGILLASMIAPGSRGWKRSPRHREAADQPISEA